MSRTSSRNESVARSRAGEHCIQYVVFGFDFSCDALCVLHVVVLYVCDRFSQRSPVATEQPNLTSRLISNAASRGWLAENQNSMKFMSGISVWTPQLVI